MNEPIYISHLKKTFTDAGSYWEFQSNEEHTEGVASLCEAFADEFGMGQWGVFLENYPETILYNS